MLHSFRSSLSILVLSGSFGCVTESEELSSTTEQPLGFSVASTSDALLELSHCPDAPTTAVLIQQLRAQLGRYFSTLDVQSVCTADGKARIGIWTTNAFDEPHRVWELANIAPSLHAGEDLAYVFTASVIQQAAAIVWARTPKVTNAYNAIIGDLLHTNDVHLVSMDPIAFGPPNTVATTVHGFVDGSAFGFGFTLDFTSTTTDILGLGIPQSSFTHLACSSSTSTIVEDPGPDSYSPTGLASAGCSVVNALPTQLMIPAGYKWLFDYTRTSVSAAGIQIGARQGALVSRDPAVSLTGPSILVVEPEDQTTSGIYVATTTDLRPPLQYSWTVTNGSAPAFNPAKATFTIPANMPAMSERLVELTVQDADGLRSIADHQVQIQRDPCGTNNQHIPNCGP